MQRKSESKTQFIMINNEPYGSVIESLITYSGLNPQNKETYIDCSNDIAKFYHDNWRDISQGAKNIELYSEDEKVFPLNQIKG